MGDVTRAHAHGVGRVVVGGVRGRIPDVVAEEDVVDLELEVVALIAEIDAPW